MATVGQTATPSPESTGAGHGAPPIAQQGALSTGQEVENITKQLEQPAPSQQTAVASQINSSPVVQESITPPKLQEKEPSEHTITKIDQHESPAKEVAEDVETMVGQFFALVEKQETKETAPLERAYVAPAPNRLNIQSIDEVRALLAELGLDKTKLSLDNLIHNSKEGLSKTFEHADQLKEVAASAVDTGLFLPETQEAPAHIFIHADVLEAIEGDDPEAAYLQKFCQDNNVTFQQAPNLVVVDVEENEWSEFVNEIAEQITVNLSRSQQPKNEVEEHKTAESASHRKAEHKTGEAPTIDRGSRKEKESRVFVGQTAEQLFQETQDKAISKMTESWQQAERERAKEAARDAKETRHKIMEERSQEKRLGG